jgi:alpha-1,3-mannosyltransferase
VLQINDRKLSAWGLPSGGARAKAKAMWPAERVVFLNDVFFCTRDVVRLLQHDGDMVCGMDFDRPKLEEMPMEVSHPLPPGLSTSTGCFYVVSYMLMVNSS